MIPREIVQRHSPIGRGANPLQKVERPVANTATNAVHSRLCRICLAGNLGFSLAGQSDVCVELHEAEYTAAVYFRQALFFKNYLWSIFVSNFNDLLGGRFDRVGQLGISPSLIAEIHEIFIAFMRRAY